NYPPLSEQLDDIDSDIRSILLFQLPIIDCYYTWQIVSTLRLVFSFQQLLKTYFKHICTLLPPYPADLTSEITNHFLITEYANLRSL
ncbi:7090_t:CDS:1, partial [Gigaspora margarita]